MTVSAKVMKLTSAFSSDTSARLLMYEELRKICQIGVYRVR